MSEQARRKPDSMRGDGEIARAQGAREALATALEPLAELLARRIAEWQLRLSPLAPAVETSPWMGVEKAAAYLDWPRGRLYKLAARGEIPHYKQEGRLLFRRDELDEWLGRFRQSTREAP